MLHTLINHEFDYARISQIDAQMLTAAGLEETIVLKQQKFDLVKELFSPILATESNEAALAHLAELSQIAPQGSHFKAALNELSSHLSSDRGFTTLASEVFADLQAQMMNALKIRLILAHATKGDDQYNEFFSYTLADNVDPATRGSGSLHGYLARMKDYIFIQMGFSEEAIKAELAPAALAITPFNALKRAVKTPAQANEEAIRTLLKLR